MSTNISFLELNNYQPLGTLTPENLKEISQKLEIVELKKGDTVFKEGDKADDHIYLYSGSVDLLKAGKALKSIKAGSPESKMAIAHIIPRNFTCTASEDTVVFKINPDLLDMMLTWDQTGSFQVEELSSDDEDDDWMTRILQTEAFHRIPPANIQAIFSSLEDINYKTGDQVIKQDEPGDYFYIIKSGRCMVTRKVPGQNNEIKLADLDVGDSFGEEALISDATRNASIVDFLGLLNEPLINKIDYTAANLKIRNGDAEWLDVRLPAEYESAHITGATHLPLIFLRMKFAELDPMKNYILYCDTERRSSSASYILSERGFKTSVLQNGTKDVPTEDMEGTNI